MATFTPAPVRGPQVARLKHGVQVFKTITVLRSAEECYQFFRRPENLPCFVKGLVSVSPITNTKWHCSSRGSNGKTIEWNLDITNDQPNRLLEWRTEEESPVTHAGTLRFEPAPPGRGTEVHLTFEFDRPMGRSLVAKMTGEKPGWEAEDNLMRFKQLIETGEIATTEGQPRGPKK